MSVALVTHRRPQDTHDAVLLLLEIARRRRISLRFTPAEAAKHEIEPAPFLEIVEDPGTGVPPPRGRARRARWPA